MLDLRRLEILHRFSILGSITATATSLGYSASAISQQLSTLEHETGAVLLERTARSAALTDAGRLLAAHADGLLAAAEEAESALAVQLGAVRGKLVVSTIPSVALAVAAALAEVQRRHPDLEIAMRETLFEPAVTAVANHVADIAVTDDWASRPGPAPAGLTRRSFETEPVVLAVAADHPLADLADLAGGAGPGDHGRPLTGREFAAAVVDMTWLCAPAGHASRTAGDRRLADLGAVPRRRWEFEGLTTIADLVADGSGCALLPRSIADAQPGDRLRSIALTPRMVRHTQALIRTSTLPAPAVALCLDAIGEHLRDRRRTARGG